MPLRGRTNNRTDPHADEIEARAAEGYDVAQLATMFGFSEYEIKSCATRKGFTVRPAPPRRRPPATPLSPDELASLRALVKADAAKYPPMSWCPTCRSLSPLDKEGLVGEHAHLRPGEERRDAAPCLGIGRQPIRK